MGIVYYAKIKNGEREALTQKKAVQLLKKAPFVSKIKPTDILGIKIHFGEKGNIGHIKPGIVRNIISELAKYSSMIFVTDTNTLYLGLRSNSIDHLRLADEHGFNLNGCSAPIIIADGVTGRNFKSIPISGKHFKSVKIASDIVNVDYLLCLSHMTGHMQTGFGAAIKNLGMGCASRAGKLEQHSSVLPEVTIAKCTGCGMCIKWCPADAIVLESKKSKILKDRCIGCGECTVVCKYGAIEIRWSESVKNLQEKISEYALGVTEAIGREKIFYLNFLDHITKDCDCMAKDEPPICADLGIMASSDPVSLDKASVDVILSGNKSDVFKKGYPDIDWSVQLSYSQSIGLGLQSYDLEPV